MVDITTLEGLIYFNPLGLLALTPEDFDRANNYLPYSTGIELECDYGADYKVENFQRIPDIMSINNDTYEQRYRIPNGVKGLICLYNISKELKFNSSMNLGSGAHYHVDCTNYSYAELQKSLVDNKQQILKELDTWGYKGEYNRRDSSWIRWNSLGTLEIRIGEMTFDYPLLAKRIIHCNSIVKDIKEEIDVERSRPIFTDINLKAIIEYNKATLYRNKDHTVSNLQNQLIQLSSQIKPEVVPEVQPQENLDDIRALIRNRSHNI